MRDPAAADLLARSAPFEVRSDGEQCVIELTIPEDQVSVLRFREAGRSGSLDIDEAVIYVRASDSPGPWQGRFFVGDRVELTRSSEPIDLIACVTGYLPARLLDVEPEQTLTLQPATAARISLRVRDAHFRYENIDVAALGFAGSGQDFMVQIRDERLRTPGCWFWSETRLRHGKTDWVPIEPDRDPTFTCHWHHPLRGRLPVKRMRQFEADDSTEESPHWIVEVLEF